MAAWLPSGSGCICWFVGGDCLLGDGMSETVIISCDECGEIVPPATSLRVTGYRGDGTHRDYCNYKCLHSWIMGYVPAVYEEADRAEYDRLRKKFEGK